jgi:hypothetical protein
MPAREFSLRVLLGFGLLLVAGCGGDPNARQSVSGTIRFKGQPLDQGRIQFVPAVKGPSEAGATIENGRYTIPHNLGLVAGSYKVAIFSYDRQGAKVISEEIPGDPVAKQFKERIPAKYNAQTELTAVVTGKGSNTFDYNLD